MAVARGDQVWQKRFGAVDDTPEVDVHHPLEVLELGDLDVSQKGEPDTCKAERLADGVFRERARNAAPQRRVTEQTRTLAETD
jgi:hypothetical protein